MNLTDGNALPRIGRRLNWHVVTLAAGLAVAISVIAGLGVMEKDTSQNPAAGVRTVSDPATASAASHTSTRPRVIIVESQGQAASLEAEMAADQMAAVMQGYEVPHQQTTFLVVSTPEDEQDLNEVLMDQLLLAEFGLEIVDLRN